MSNQQLAKQPAQTVAITPMDMLQIAVEQGADLDKLQQLMDMKNKWEADEARKAFTVALAAFKANPPKLIKSKHVNFTTTKGNTDYWHAPLDEVCDLVGRELSAHGLSHRWSVTQENGGICVACILEHTLGHREEVQITASADQSGGKNAVQAIGSTVTYLQRYTLLAATGLAAADQDTDGVAPATAPDLDGEIVKQITDCSTSGALDVLWKELDKATRGDYLPTLKAHKQLILDRSEA